MISSRRPALLSLFFLSSAWACQQKATGTDNAGKESTTATATNTAATATGSAQVAKQPGTQPAADGSAWPTGASPELKLTWAVYPPTGSSPPKRRLELVARIGDVARRQAIGALEGTMPPALQSVCTKSLAKGEVSRIGFSAASGNVKYAVTRPNPASLEIVSIVESDGYCPEHNCDTKTVVAKMSIPSDATIVEAISDIRGAGNEGPFACSGATPTGSASAGGSGQTTFWAPEVVTLNGTLVKKQIQYSPGPVPVVVFDAPIRVVSKPGSKGGDPPLPSAQEAWLSYNGIDKNAVAKLIGKKVTYRGTLQPMQTGHHHSNPWLDGTVIAR